MKKMITLINLLVVGLFVSQLSLHADQVKDSLVYQNFNNLTALPTGWKQINTSNKLGVFSRAGSTVAVSSGVLSFSATNGSGNRGVEIGLDTLRNKELVYLELDWTVNSSIIGPTNALAFYLLGSKSRNVTSETPSEVYADVIAGIYLVGNTGKFHYWNQDILGPSALKTNPTDTLAVLNSGVNTGIKFLRAGTDNATTNALNEAASVNANFITGKTYHFLFALNFTTKKVQSLTITQQDDATNAVTITDKPFVSSAVTDFFSFGTINTKASNSTVAGSNITYNVSIDNFLVYEYIEGGTTGLQLNNQSNKGIKSEDYFNVAGAKSLKTQRGLLLKRTTFSDGSISTEKIFNK